MMRDSLEPLRMLASLSLLAGAGCLSMEPISSYSSGQREVQAPPAALEPESPVGPSEPEGGEGDMELSGAEVPPADDPAAGQAMEGLPGDGEVALDPGGVDPGGVDPGSVEPPPVEPEPMLSCAGPGEFASSDGARCYLSSSENATWLDALASCQSWGGSLVVIDSREEDDFLREQVSVTFWIGASDRVVEGQMFWAGGVPIVYDNWSEGQPDDFQGREDCAVKTAPAGTWNDRPCGNLNPYVCERGAD